jgi:hypothetical protein
LNSFRKNKHINKTIGNSIKKVGSNLANVARKLDGPEMREPGRSGSARDIHCVLTCRKSLYALNRLRAGFGVSSSNERPSPAFYSAGFKKEKIMPFREDCSCHAFAIDGWTDTATATNVDNRYIEVATRQSQDLEVRKFLPAGTPMFTGSFTWKLAKLIQECRITGNTDRDARMYGAFQAVDSGAPNHMWIEYEGYIYDTMPGNQLLRIPATAITRFFPPSEGGACTPALVAWSYAFLTTAQLQNISANDWVPAQNAAGRQFESSSPA